MVKGHRPVIVKWAVIGSKGGWKLSTIFLSCNVFHDWSLIKLRKYIVFIRRVYIILKIIEGQMLSIITLMHFV